MPLRGFPRPLAHRTPEGPIRNRRQTASAAVGDALRAAANSRGSRPAAAQAVAPRPPPGPWPEPASGRGWPLSLVPPRARRVEPCTAVEDRPLRALATSDGEPPSGLGQPQTDAKTAGKGRKLADSAARGEPVTSLAERGVLWRRKERSLATDCMSCGRHSGPAAAAESRGIESPARPSSARRPTTRPRGPRRAPLPFPFLPRRPAAAAAPSCLLAASAKRREAHQGTEGLWYRDRLHHQTRQPAQHCNGRHLY